MVLCGQEGIDVVELTAAMLEPDGCLRRVGAGLLLTQPAPHQARECADHGATTTRDAAIDSSLPGRRRPLPGRHPSSPIGGTVAPHSGQPPVDRPPGCPDARRLRMPYPHFCHGRGLGPDDAGEIAI
jgi:hypothetical protein